MPTKPQLGSKFQLDSDPQRGEKKKDNERYTSYYVRESKNYTYRSNIMVIITNLTRNGLTLLKSAGVESLMPGRVIKKNNCCQTSSSVAVAKYFQIKVLSLFPLSLFQN